MGTGFSRLMSCSGRAAAGENDVPRPALGGLLLPLLDLGPVGVPEERPFPGDELGQCSRQRGVSGVAVSPLLEEVQGDGEVGELAGLCLSGERRFDLFIGELHQRPTS